jgi:hypothetical protein
MHQHKCQYCKGLFVCSEDAAECFASYITCDDCYWTTDFVHFIIVLVLAGVAIALTLVIFFHYGMLPPGKTMPEQSTEEFKLSRDRCVCGHRRIAHVHYNGNSEMPESAPSYCGYPDYDGSGLSICCPCEQYKKADVLPHQPFELVRLAPELKNTTGEKYNNAQENTNRGTGAHR